ncbi:hypothetical protein LR48_Vigan10g033300 [Vigna angularis]|uniref:Uncharacterized protein n=1 Tax=Phaseolus angularis TaxID=3914 RepID=A0A0L9VHD4_PHAAN|nr:hypothetical protein LR48_Vigan10g033300 [Vigna angularis]
MLDITIIVSSSHWFNDFCYYRGWTTDRKDVDTTDRVLHPREDLDAPDRVFRTWYDRAELVNSFILIPSAEEARGGRPSEGGGGVFPDGGWTTDRKDVDTTDRVLHPREDLDAPDRVFRTWYDRAELVTVLVEYLKYALKAIKRLARAHSDLIVGVFAAGQLIHTDTERRRGERRKTERRRRRSVSGRR